MPGAVCLTSGGQDSTTCLYWAKQHFDPLYGVAFDYGQRHRLELEAAQTICDRAQVPLTILKLNVLRQLGGSPLIGDEGEISDRGGRDGLPNSFIPGRNLFFLTAAAAFAYQREISNLITGVCETDYSGYPDCRHSTMKAMEQALTLGMDHPFTIHTPLMYLTKAQTVNLAQEVGALEAMAYSHTCYEGVFPPCQTCPACKLRRNGFEQAGLADPLIVRAQAQAQPS